MLSNSIHANRQKGIYNILRQKGIVKVTELSEMFGVSATIRRDVDEFEPFLWYSKLKDKFDFNFVHRAISPCGNGCYH